MSIPAAVIAAAIVFTSAHAAAAHSVAPAEARAVEQGLAGGTWTGKFLQKDWMFEFRNEDGSLKGKYMTAGGREWQPLNEIVVSKRRVTFNLGSKPNASFDLEIGAADRNLSGTVTLEGFGTIPFVAARTS